MVSGYPDDVIKRINLLRREKIKVSGSHVEEMDRYFFDDFNSKTMHISKTD
jgi:hypothetical protein